MCLYNTYTFVVCVLLGLTSTFGVNFFENIKKRINATILLNQSSYLNISGYVRKYSSAHYSGPYLFRFVNYLRYKWYRKLKKYLLVVLILRKRYKCAIESIRTILIFTGLFLLRLYFLFIIQFFKAFFPVLFSNKPSKSLCCFKEILLKFFSRCLFLRVYGFITLRKLPRPLCYRCLCFYLFIYNCAQ